MLPTEILVEEHRIILAVIDAAEKEVKSVGAGAEFNGEKIEKMVDFFKNFADTCHHAKEEKLLFPKMEEKGMNAEGGPIAVMLADHNTGRAYLGKVRQALPQASAGDAESVSVVLQNIGLFANMLKHHIYKEDNILYPMADQMFNDADQQDLLDKFADVEKNEIGEGVHEKYHKLAHELIG